nr:spindle assembly checkpoint component mad1-like [Leptinotarsa decemlineata]
MTQRLKSCSNSINLETIACERYMARLLNREKSSTPNSANSKDRDRSRKQSSVNQNQLSKIKSNVKQQNFPSPKLSQSPTRSGPQYTDDSAFVEVTVKTTNPRQRSRSTTVDREPWAQLLKQQKSGEKVSVFGNFDPLRTLHFLAKELQFQLQAILPDDSNLQQVVADMQYALKRVPPEVASTVHLQQAVDMVPRRTSSKSLSDKPEKLKTSTCEKVTQTPACVSTEEKDKLQRIMEQSTIKLEASCRQMERLCTELKNEKENLEKQLLAERNNVVFYKKRIADLELENNEILNPRLRVLEEEKRKLEFEQQKLESEHRKLESNVNSMECELNMLRTKREIQSVDALDKLKAQIDDLKKEKNAIELECNKLRHQVALSALEKEKYVTVLALRDKQINEIRTEMTQLQEVVNEQLTELHNGPFQTLPNKKESDKEDYSLNTPGGGNNKENIGDIGDNTMATIYNSEDPQHPFYICKPHSSFRDLPSGDLDTSTLLQEVPDDYFSGRPTKDKKPANSLDTMPLIEKLDSHASIRSLFNDVKKTAFAVANTPSRVQSRYNIVEGRH